MPNAHHFHFQEFSDVAELVALKKNQRISVCIPTLNEAKTIASIISIIREHLVLKHSLVNEILVIDSGSTDDTRAIASAAGADVFLSVDIAPEHGSYIGKGENLWKALHVATGDIICHVDGDISDFHQGFIYGLVGPLLHSKEIQYVKGYYERPLTLNDEKFSSGGGRVTEILIRPLLSLFYPELTSILQPLAGEYAARRATLENLAYPIGYGVEIAHLIDLMQLDSSQPIAQTNLVRRTHRHQTDENLGCMAFALLQVIFRRLERDHKLSLSDPLHSLYTVWSDLDKQPRPLTISIPEPERPPFKNLKL